jgi:hypothetical protein
MAYPSTFLDLQDAVIGKLRLDPTPDRPRVKDWINQVYAQVCVETEATQKQDTVTTTIDTASYNLPDAVIRVREIVSAGASDPTSYGPPLEQVSLDELLTLRQSGTVAYTNQGAATKYALAGMNQLELYPTPTSVDTLLLFYVYLPAALVGDAAISALPEPYASKLLEYGALAEAADFIGHPEQDRYRALYEDWLRRFRTHLARRRGAGAGQLRVMGEPVVAYARDIDRGY